MSGGIRYASFDLGRRSRGEIVRVRLHGNAANVRLLDASAYSAYRQGRQHRYHGGHYTRSPIQLQVPSNGHWYVVVDHGGLAGNTRAEVEVLPGALPPAFQPLQAGPLDVIRENVQSAFEAGTDPEREWDVFVSHAGEDKEEVVRPLAEALQLRGLRVWYDEFELRIGDSLRRKIDEGLARSRFGVVVLSHHFFSKNWPQRELDGLAARESTDEQIILPLWHKITKDEVISYSPTLADRLARSTSDYTIDEIAEEIATVVQPPATS
jgi:hypothetical protein